MGRIHLGVGTRYAWDGRAGVVIQVLGDGRLVVEDQSAGGQEVLGDGRLVVEDQSAGGQEVLGDGRR